MIIPITALMTCIFIGYIAGVDVIGSEVELSGQFKRKKMFIVMIKYIAPVLLLAILVSSVLETLGYIAF